MESYFIYIYHAHDLNSYIPTAVIILKHLQYYYYAITTAPEDIGLPQGSALQPKH